jgi:hypothetical protein
MPIDYSGLAFPKGQPRVLLEKAQAKAEGREWKRTIEKVDKRDGRKCQVTGVLLTAGAVDPWKRLERHHLEYRSKNKGRRFTEYNVWTCSAGVHQCIHGGALKILNRAGLPAKDVREIDHVAWNRKLVPIGEEPCKVKLPVRRDTQ